MNDTSTAIFSDWSPRIALFAGALICMVILLHRLLGMPTPLALNLFVVAFGLAALAVLLGLVALADVWRRGVEGAGWALIGIAFGGGIFAWPASFAQRYLDLPAISEATTDLQSPPRFSALAAARSRSANPPEYPVAKFAPLQQAAYPDLRPLYVNRTSEEAYEIALETAKRLRFDIVAEVPPKGDVPGRIEAVDRTLVIGFYDDVVIRVGQDGRRSRFDVRSSSRYGEHDLGRNATRVRRVLAELQTRADASVTTPSQRFARIKAHIDKAKEASKRARGGNQRRADRRRSRDGVQSGVRRAPARRARPPSRVFRQYPDRPF
jgi:uncharacterized protein (DUF1499 family)